MAANQCVAGQARADRENSTYALALRECVRIINKDQELWHRISAYPIEGEGMASFLQPVTDQCPSNFDSMVGTVISWAKDEVAAVRRQELADTVHNLRMLQRQINDSKNLGKPPPRHLTPLEQELLDNCHRIRHTDYMFDDTKVSVSEFCKTITKQSIFLEDVGNKGGGWHNPLLVTVRLKEGAGSRRRQGDQNPYRRYQNTLGLAALAAKIVVSEATEVTDSCPNIITNSTTILSEEQDTWSGDLLLIVLIASVILNLVFICFGEWFFTPQRDDPEPLPEPPVQDRPEPELPVPEPPVPGDDQAHLNEQQDPYAPFLDIRVPDEERCSTTGCLRRRNPGFPTCCQFCPRTGTHSHQCNRRQGIARVDRVDQPVMNQENRIDRAAAFPVPAQPGFDPPPTRMIDRYFVPAQISVTRTGDKYHFNQRCQFFRMNGGRVLTPCEICTHMTRRQGIFVLTSPGADAPLNAPHGGQPAIENAD